MPWLPPPNTAGLIFDCDGTLADTMPVHYRAWTVVLGPPEIDDVGSFADEGEEAVEAVTESRVWRVLFGILLRT